MPLTTHTHRTQVQREHIQLAPLCACAHGACPLDPGYAAVCATNCPLRGAPARWAALLRFALDSKGLLAGGK